ncbi:Uncharacterized protein APZ42_026298 [Daphnia magna]|uniref:Uncharacterized protein n=2 Tax=Daphnia magna TaxID=35525 RepID=A0ABR0ABN1_9CRUS|nr:hypothetical protein OUZ56_007900 [Daphnia magna]KZS09478.1 Uncharacterized protein APZ42_026298 [Daphnia magna]
MDLVSFPLNDCHGYSVKFSPFVERRIACVASQNYGLSGSGFLFILDLSPSNHLTLAVESRWTDGLFDLAFAEDHPDIILTASGDGGIQLWDLKTPEVPKLVWKEHSREVCCLDWNQTRQQQLVLSSSWDRSIKLWDPKGTNSLCTFLGHSDLVYNVSWSPHLPNCFASVSGDHTLCIWNSTKPGQPVVKLTAHPTEVLACDWSKYDRNVIVTGGVDGRIKAWDLRNTSTPCFELIGHEYAVKRLRFSPHQAHLLASCSYDMTTRVWDTRHLQPEVFSHHREFVYGLDFSCLTPDKIVDCSWDRTVSIYTPPSVLNTV